MTKDIKLDLDAGTAADIIDGVKGVPAQWKEVGEEGAAWQEFVTDAALSIVDEDSDRASSVRKTLLEMSPRVKKTFGGSDVEWGVVVDFIVADFEANCADSDGSDSDGSSDGGTTRHQFGICPRCSKICGDNINCRKLGEEEEDGDGSDSDGDSDGSVRVRLLLGPAIDQHVGSEPKRRRVV
jgi:hypothetical protein